MSLWATISTCIVFRKVEQFSRNPAFGFNAQANTLVCCIAKFTMQLNQVKSSRSEMIEKLKRAP